jgi:NAD(P)-dependent dehydrogenase (short-subunit alcohol dehydrogenase family)
MIAIDLTSRVAIVTGGNRGIGRGIAEMLARAGATTVVVSRHLAECESIATQLAREYRVPTLGLALDVTQPDGIHAMIGHAVQRFGRLDVMVNNAGLAGRADALEITVGVWDAVVNTNLRGAFFCAQAAAKVMKGQGGGSIINIGSVHSLAAMRLYAHYGASKAGLAQLTRVLAHEWGEHQIRVNCVAPGSVPTDINREVLAVPENRQRNINKTALKRLGTPHDIAALVAFLASDLAGYVTGQTIYVDGGWTLS